MTRVTVTELKNRLSEYLRLVKRGETIEVTERSVPVAVLQPARGSAASGNPHLRRLVRDGIVAVARKRTARDLLKKPAVHCSGDAVKALIDERGDR